MEPNPQRPYKPTGNDAYDCLHEMLKSQNDEPMADPFRQEREKAENLKNSQTPNVQPPQPTTATSQTARDDLVSMVAQYFGASVKPVVLRMHDPGFTAPLRDLFSRMKENPEIVSIPAGPDSDQLCAVSIVEENTAALQQFLSLNPAFQKSASISWWGSIYMLVRINGWRPASQWHNMGTWISDGMMPVVEITPGQKATPLVVGGDIPVMEFDDLKWPAALEDKFFQARILAEYGPYYRVLGPRKKVLNEEVFCRIIARSSGLLYDTDTHTYCQRWPGEKSYKPIAKPDVISLVTKCLTGVAAADPNNFPANELRLPRIKSMVEHLKTVVAFTRANARESLIEYVRTRLCPKTGSTLTVEEIQADYLEYGRLKNMSLYPQAKFHVELPQVMLAQFNVSRVNRIQRPSEGTNRSTCRRGFNGVVLKGTLGTPGTGGTAGTG